MTRTKEVMCVLNRFKANKELFGPYAWHWWIFNNGFVLCSKTNSTEKKNDDRQVIVKYAEIIFLKYN